MPDEEEIKRLTSDEAGIEVAPPDREINENIAAAAKSDNLAEKKSAAKVNSSDGNSAKRVEAADAEKINPFLLTRGQNSEIGVEKTGYRLRSDYMDLLKLVKRMKKGYTLEAVLDDALSFYFENSEDGRKAVKHRELLDSE